MPSLRLPHLLSLALILAFWAVGVASLDRQPTIHEDESWIAAPGYNFWERGTFGTDLFAGFYGMERHYYDFPPLFSLIVGGALHLFGMGLFQARIVPLSLMMFTLALTHRLGTRLFSPWHGTLAVAMLVSWRVAQPTSHLVSGIPLADLARIARYDAAVPVFGLAALLLLLAGLRRNSRPGYFLAGGVLAGLAMLCHLYGAFWLPVLVIILLLQRRGLRAVLLTCVGFGAAVTPWLIFIASGWEDFVGQYHIYGSRFGLLDGNFYTTNLSAERERYQPVLDALTQSLGTKVALALLVLGVIWLTWQAIVKKEAAARILLIATVTIVGFFALLLSMKTFNYLATLWPLLALVATCGWRALWRLTAGRAGRIVLAALFVGVMAEGGVAVVQMQRVAQQMTSYRDYTNSIAALLPPGSRVLGLQHYWLGLAEATTSYRSILVPMDLTNPRYVDTPIPFAEAAQAIPPDIVLLDETMLDFLDDIATTRSDLYWLGRQIQAYLLDRQARLISEVYDSTYGRIQIYQLNANLR